jgi:hypothetical protein
MPWPLYPQERFLVPTGCASELVWISAEVKYPLHLLEFKPRTIELTDNELLIKCLLFTGDVSTVIASVLHFPFHALQFKPTSCISVTVLCSCCTAH